MTFLFLKLSKVKIFPSAVIYTKNATLEGALTLHTLLQGNGELVEMNRLIKGPYFKLPPFRGDPTYFILTALSQANIIQKIKERSDHIHLLIMHQPGKRYILLNIYINELHMIRHPRLLIVCNTK
jgi:hypothetical protein